MSEILVAPQIKLKKGSLRKLILLGSGLAGVFVLFSVSPYQIKMTSSESVPHSLFVVNVSNPDDVKRGDYVSVLAPDRPEAGIEYLKLVAGVAGDEVRVDGRDIYVAGIYRGRAKTHSKKGSPLGVTTSAIIGEGQIYIFGDHIDSYDSRYSDIGLVSKDLITGRAKPLL